MDGLALYRLVYPVPQGMTDVSSSILIIGIDSDGREVRGGELFRRCGLLSAEEMAMRAIDILLARNGAQWLVPGALPSYVHAFGNGDITLPFIRNDSLFFWIAEGDLVPTATRIMVDLSTGHFQRLSDSHE